MRGRVFHKKERETRARREVSDGNIMTKSFLIPRTLSHSPFSISLAQLLPLEHPFRGRRDWTRASPSEIGRESQTRRYTIYWGKEQDRGRRMRRENQRIRSLRGTRVKLLHSSPLPSGINNGLPLSSWQLTKR